MKKRFLSLILVLLMQAGIPACAESLFTLPSMEKVVSYGVQMGAEPVSETTLEDGSLVQVYGNVTNDAFSQFGVILNKMGYALASQNTVNGVLTVSIVKGDISFDIEYDLTAGMLGVRYPAGLEIEATEIPGLFGEYIPLNFRESVRIKNPETGEDWGDVTINEFVALRPGKNIERSIRNIRTGEVHSGSDYLDTQMKVYILGTFESVTKEDIKANLLFDATLHYINTDNHYTYSGQDMHSNATDDGSCLDIGIIEKENKAVFDTYREKGLFSKTIQRFAPVIDSLSTLNIAAEFAEAPFVTLNLGTDDGRSKPNGLIYTSDDGILAVTFKFAGIDTPYVLYIRK